MTSKNVMIEKENSNQIRILVIEDEIVQGKRIVQEFTSRGFKPELCHDIDNASEILEKKDFDLIFADVHIFNGSSVDFIRSARQIQPFAILVGVSGVHGSSEVSRMRDICDSFIDKPIKFEKLAKSIEEKINERSSILRMWLKDQNVQKIEIGELEVEIFPFDATDDPNIIKFMKKKPELAKQFPDEYVAILDGEIVDHDIDRSTLRVRVIEKYDRGDFLLMNVTSPIHVIPFRRPWKVLERRSRK